MQVIAHHKHATNITGAERWLSGFCGGLALVTGLHRRSLKGFMLAAGGADLIRRGLTGHSYAYEWLGIRTARKGQGEEAISVPYELGVRVDESITINWPRSEMYRFWRRLENIEQFMEPVKSLTELRTFNLTHIRAGAIRYGQSNLDISDELDVRQDRAKYEADRAKDIALAGEHGLGAALEAHKLDALLFPGWNISGLASRPGYPEIVVPLGMIPSGGGGQNPFPAGFTPQPAPYAAAFVGAACSEPRLIAIAYAFEQATKRRVAPSATP